MFDSILHQPNRLKILSILSVNETLSFIMLQKMMGITKGNLSSHMKQLSTEGYVKINKFFENNKPKTEYKISAEGREALKKYLEEMEEFLASLKEASNLTK
jgi:predicted transcriptional regulator